MGEINTVQVHVDEESVKGRRMEGKRERKGERELERKRERERGGGERESFLRRGRYMYINLSVLNCS